MQGTRGHVAEANFGRNRGGRSLALTRAVTELAELVAPPAIRHAARGNAARVGRPCIELREGEPYVHHRGERLVLRTTRTELTLLVPTPAQHIGPADSARVIPPGRQASEAPTPTHRRRPRSVGGAAVSELADSSVNLVVRVWCASGDYWPLKFALTKALKERFDAEGISIPYPQQQIHMAPEAASSLASTAS